MFAAAPPVEHERYERADEGWTLELALPLVEKDALELFQAGSDLVVRVGATCRCMPLPNVLAGFDVAGARLDEGVLRVTFAKGDQDER